MTEKHKRAFEDLEIFPTGEIPLIDIFMAEQDIPRSRWLLGTKWQPSDIDQVEKISSASLRELDILYRNVFRLSKYPDVGLRFGTSLNLSRWGIFGTAMLSAKDLSDALLTQRRFLPLMHSRFDMNYEVINDDVVISADHNHTWPLAIEEKHSLEILASTLCSHLSVLLDEPFLFKLIDFPFPKPAYFSSYSKYCSVSSTFNASQMKMWIPVKFFSYPLKLSNPVAFKQAVDICESELQKLLDYQTKDSCQLVRHALSKCKSKFPKLEEMASQLHISPRTLKRRLNQSNTSYRSLVKNAQLEMAQQLLVDQHIPISDIAKQCGFHNTAGLRDAFKRHLNTTPSNFRKKLHNMIP
jgi:AraC-like DNA-binding protein